MKPSTQRAMDRLLRSMARPPRPRPRRLSLSAIYLALGLVLGYQLLVRFVPMVWGSLLPGGLTQANQLRGWPGVVWRLAIVAHVRFPAVATTLGIVGAAGFLLGAIRPLRLLVWLAAVVVIAIDAGILILTLQTALAAGLQNAGIG
jgi:hypothetical protein